MVTAGIVTQTAGICIRRRYCDILFWDTRDIIRTAVSLPDAICRDNASYAKSNIFAAVHIVFYFFDKIVILLLKTNQNDKLSYLKQVIHNEFIF